MSDDPQEPEEIVNLFQSDRVAIVATTRIHGWTALAFYVAAPGLQRIHTEDELKAMAEPMLRRKLGALAQQHPCAPLA